MKFRTRRPETPPSQTGQVSDHAARLSRVRPLVHDEDEPTVRPGAHRTVFDSLLEPVDYPRWLKPRKSRRRS
jgi:hypothetical protein